MITGASIAPDIGFVFVTDAVFSVADAAASDSKLCDDFRTYHAPQYAVQYSKFHFVQMHCIQDCIYFAIICLLVLKAVYGIHGKSFIVRKIDTIGFLRFSSAALEFAVKFTIASKFDGNFNSFAVFAIRQTCKPAKM